MRRFKKILSTRMSGESSKNTLIAAAIIVVLIAVTWVWKGGFALPSVKAGGGPMFFGALAVTIALVGAIYYVYKRM